MRQIRTADRALAPPGAPACALCAPCKLRACLLGMRGGWACRLPRCCVKWRPGICYKSVIVIALYERPSIAVFYMGLCTAMALTCVVRVSEEDEEDEEDEEPLPAVKART